MAACQEKDAAASYLLPLSNGAAPLLQHQHQGEGILVQLHQLLRDEEQHQTKAQQFQPNDYQQTKQQQGNDRDALSLKGSSIMKGAAIAAAIKRKDGPNSINSEYDSWEDASDLSISDEDVLSELHNITSNNNIYTNYRDNNKNYQIREGPGSGNTSATRRRNWGKGKLKSNRGTRDAFQSIDSLFSVDYDNRQALFWGRQGRGRHVAENKAVETSMAVASLSNFRTQRKHHVAREKSGNTNTGSTKEKLSNQLRRSSNNPLTDQNDAYRDHTSTISTRGSSGSSSLLSWNSTTCGSISKWSDPPTIKPLLLQSLGAADDSSGVSKALAGASMRENSAAGNAGIPSPCSRSSNSGSRRIESSSAATESTPGDKPQEEAEAQETRNTHLVKLLRIGTPVAVAGGTTNEESHLAAARAATRVGDRTRDARALAALEAGLEGKGATGQGSTADITASALACDGAGVGNAGAMTPQKMTTAASREREQPAVPNDLEKETTADPAAGIGVVARDVCVKAFERNKYSRKGGTRRQQHPINRKMYNIGRRARVISDVLTGKRVTTESTREPNIIRSDSLNEAAARELSPRSLLLLQHEGREQSLWRDIAAAAEGSQAASSSCYCIPHTEGYGNSKSNSRSDFNSNRYGRRRKPDDSKKRSEIVNGNTSSSNSRNSRNNGRASSYFQGDLQEWDDFTSLDEMEELEHDLFDEAYADLLGYDLDPDPWMLQAPRSSSGALVFALALHNTHSSQLLDQHLYSTAVTAKVAGPL